MTGSADKIIGWTLISLLIASPAVMIWGFAIMFLDARRRPDRKARLRRLLLSNKLPSDTPAGAVLLVALGALGGVIACGGLLVWAKVSPPACAAPARDDVRVSPKS